MRIHRWKDIEKGKLSADEIAQGDRWVEEQVVELNLQELRKALGKTQSDVARAARMTQGELSRAERRTDHLVSTLRRYVESLGGSIEVTARFGRRRVRLKGV
jgi:hypothetical protein